MNVQVRFFASLRERVGFAERSLLLPEGATAADAWNQAVENIVMPDNVLVAINMEYSRLDSQVADGDEVAFFPPVTGG